MWLTLHFSGDDDSRLIVAASVLRVQWRHATEQLTATLPAKGTLNTSDILNSSGASVRYFEPPWLVGKQLSKVFSWGRPAPVTLESMKMGHILIESGGMS